MAKRELKPKKEKVSNKIEDCKDCKGNPIRSSFEAVPFKGEKCDLCFRVLNYELL